MKRWILITLLLVVGVSGGRLATAQDEADTPLPLLVLIEFDPWGMVLGSDSPTFALYDNGLVIYRYDGGYYSIQLDAAPSGDLLGRFGVTAAFGELEDYYDTVLMTDQPSNGLHVWQDGQRKTVWVYGDLRADPEARSATPSAFLDIFDQVAAFDDARAMPWLPEFLEVMIWPFDTSEAAVWPSEWPNLSSESTIVRYADQYSIFVPSMYYADYLALRFSADAVRLNGETWAFALRFPFPAETLWLHEAEATELALPDPEAVVEAWQTWAAQALTGDWEMSYDLEPFINITWSNSTLNAVAFGTIFLTPSPYTFEQATELINDEWIEVALSHYESYVIRHRCTVNNDSFLLVEIRAELNDTSYLFGLWTWVDSMTFNTFSLVLPVTNGPEWKRIATTLFGEGALCPVG